MSMKAFPKFLKTQWAYKSVFSTSSLLLLYFITLVCLTKSGGKVFHFVVIRFLILGCIKRDFKEIDVGSNLHVSYE